jgi:hypothetical protein
MKAKFLKDTSVDILDANDELYNKFFRKDDEVQVADGDDHRLVSLGSQFVNILLMNGELLLDVPRNSVIILK